MSSLSSVIAVMTWFFFSCKHIKNPGKEHETGCLQSKETNYLSTKITMKVPDLSQTKLALILVLVPGSKAL